MFVRGEQISGEYGGARAGEPEEHRPPQADGWFATRDRGRLDADGYLFIEGRADDTIIRGGENIAPAETGLAPVRAIPKALSRAGLAADEVDLFEINEAFAAMCVATVRLLGLDPDRVNVNGSGCSLGHPVAATGARMLVTLVHELRRRGGGVGVAAMCAGGGMGSATVIEVAAP